MADTRRFIHNRQGATPDNIVFSILFAGIPATAVKCTVIKRCGAGLTLNGDTATNITFTIQPFSVNRREGNLNSK
jgi:hypothetical protein